MIFPYTEFPSDGTSVFRPTLPITFSHNGVKIPIGHALVDTGADYTLLPLSIACAFGFQFDLEKDKELWNGAGGGKFPVYKSPTQIGCKIEHHGFRPKEWKATVFFTINQPTILLGHKGCLERFHLLFKGREKELEILS